MKQFKIIYSYGGQYNGAIVREKIIEGATAIDALNTFNSLWKSESIYNVIEL